jgi:hypothetical protein
VSNNESAEPRKQTWPIICIFWLLFICLYHSWSLPNFVWINISGYQNYRSSLLTGFRAFIVWHLIKFLCLLSYIFHVFSQARDHILILYIWFFNKLRQIIPEIRSQRRDLLTFIFILKTTVFWLLFICLHLIYLLFVFISFCLSFFRFILYMCVCLYWIQLFSRFYQK